MPIPTAPLPPTATSTTRTEAAIAQGARATGTDFTYLLAQARLESSLNPNAKARTSSASGLFQFIDSTWLATLDRHGAAHGLGWVSGAIGERGGRHFVADPVLRAEIMALRHDPAVASLMAGALAQDNRAALLPVLGREPEAAELYLAHFLGAGGASSFLRQLQTGPGSPAAALLPEAAAANRRIFYEGGAPRSVAGVMDLIRNKVTGAMEAGGAPPSAPPGAPQLAGWSGHTPTTSHHSAPLRSSATPAAPPMSAILERTFGGANSDAAAPAHVRAAYGKLRAFAL